ncbi:MAG: peptidoglycan editing factor PgeF [Phycisphaeraceae bacterium]|nr:peptidoglycan editing factor PgeF [Phycisphaeraceae bacterium]
MGTLERVRTGGQVFLRSPKLASMGVPHGFSTRHGGVSAAPFDSMNLGRAGGVPVELSDPAENRAENLRRFQSAVGLSDRRVARVHQVHGAAIVEVSVSPPAGGPRRDPASEADPQADALVSVAPGAAMMVTIADCAAILLACPRSGAVAAIHAGWRGVVAEVVHAAVERLVALRAEREELRAALGPCIGVEAFEVGEEVAHAFRDLGLGACVRARASAKPTIDLAAAVIMQLEAAGLSSERIDRADACTVAGRSEFFSYRRDGARSGRMAAIIGSPKAP